MSDDNGTSSTDTSTADTTTTATTASGTTASGTTASGTTASGTTASGTTASGTTASGTTASGTAAGGRNGERPPRRPDGVDDATVEATGKLSEGLEYVERARGHLYSFHQLMGHADMVFGEAADKLAAAGHGELADRVRHEAVGRNVLENRWTFQIVEEYDDGYYHPVAAVERAVRNQLMDGIRHVYESELKGARHQPGQPGPTPAQP